MHNGQTPGTPEQLARRKRVFLAAGALIAFAASNWASMNVGFEYGADTSGCIAFDMLTELPAKEIPMCDRAAVTPLLAPRKAWLWMTGDQIPASYFKEQPK